MESLYRAYRPQTFSQVVGQKPVVETLERGIRENRLGHAYLFCGPRGTGKTTMARILSKALLCEQGEGQLPDGTCETCQAIAEGNHPDVHELDAASRTGVDAVRDEIINRVDFAPTKGKYKVYIIDEVHMLTKAAFNALLKTLEEPPSHVVFILCTTDPQMIPATILSRVQRFDFHSITNAEIQDHLAFVSEQEGFTAEPEALAMIARHARGGMRDALSSLEQLSVFGNGSITVDAARSLFGMADESRLNLVCAALQSGDVPALFKLVAQAAADGEEMLQFASGLESHMRDLYVTAIAGDVPELVSASGDEYSQLASQAAAFGSPQRILNLLMALGDLVLDLRRAPDPRLTCEVALIRMARPQDDATLSALAARVEALEQALASGVPAPASSTSSAAPVSPAMPQTLPASGAPRAEKLTPSLHASPTAPAPQPQPAPQPAIQPRSAVQPKPAAQPQATAPSQPVQPASGPQPAPSPQSAPTAEPQPASAAQTAPQPTAATQSAAAPTPASAANADLEAAWQKVLIELKKAIPAAHALIAASHPLSDDGQTLEILLPATSGFALGILSRADIKPTIDAQVQSVLGRRSVRFGTEGQAASVPAAKPAPAAAKPAPVSTPAPQPAPTQVSAAAPSPVPAAAKPAPASAPPTAPSLTPAPSASPAASAASMTPPWEEAPSRQPEPAPAPESYPDDMPPYDDYVPAESYEDFGSFEPTQEPQAPSTPEPGPVSAPAAPVAQPAVTPPAPAEIAPIEAVQGASVAPEPSAASASPIEPDAPAAVMPEGLSAEEQRVFQVVEAAFGSEVRVLPADPTNPLSQ